MSPRAGLSKVYEATLAEDLRAVCESTLDYVLADELYAIVDKQEKNARNKAYSYFMTYGRSKALPKLKEVAKDKD